MSDLIETGHTSSPITAGTTKAEIMGLVSEATRHSITHPGLLLREVSGFEDGSKKGNSVVATVEKNTQQSFQRAKVQC